LENVWARHAWLAHATREGVKAMGLTLFAQTPCNVLTSIHVPPALTAKKSSNVCGKNTAFHRRGQVALSAKSSAWPTWATWTALT